MPPKTHTNFNVINLTLDLHQIQILEITAAKLCDTHCESRGKLILENSQEFGEFKNYYKEGDKWKFI